MPEEVVLVTGASGYIGTHVVKALLEEGYKVRGTVRSLQNAAKTEPLKNLVPDAQHPLELVEADLTKDEGWDNAVEGCTVLMHVASPFPNVAERSVREEDVIGPAKEGTLRVLKAAVGAHVKRVVLTSSIVSVCAESDPDPAKVFAEEDWADPESPSIDSYSKSKVLAEKAAWEYLGQLPGEQKFELSVVNPSFVLGPVLMESHKDATSVAFLAQILNKTYPALPRLGFNICDVRDVAQAHLKALSVPESVGKRHIIMTENMWLKDIAAVVAKEFHPQGYSIPTGQLPYFACWLASFFNKQMKTYILPRVGKTFKLSNDRMVKVLGISPRASETTILDMAYSLVDIGIVRKAKMYKQVGSRAEPSSSPPLAADDAGDAAPATEQPAEPKEEADKQQQQSNDSENKDEENAKN